MGAGYLLPKDHRVTWYANKSWETHKENVISKGKKEGIAPGMLEYFWSVTNSTQFKDDHYVALDYREIDKRHAPTALEK